MYKDDRAQNPKATELLILMSVPEKRNNKLDNKPTIPTYENDDTVMSSLKVGSTKVLV